MRVLGSRTTLQSLRDQRIAVRRRRIATCPPPTPGPATRLITCHSAGKEMHRVLGETTPAHRVLRAGLRALVVALDPVRLRPLSGAHRLLRPLPRCAGRAGHHPRQERDRRSATADGALASRTAVVRRGALAPCGG